MRPKYMEPDCEQDIAAFPTGGTYTHRDGSLMSVEHKGGMSLRDYFAAVALQGLLAHPERGSSDDVAKEAYEMAGAMLKVRDDKVFPGLVEQLETARMAIRELMPYLNEDYHDGEGFMTPGYKAAIEGVKKIAG